MKTDNPEDDDGQPNLLEEAVTHFKDQMSKECPGGPGEPEKPTPKDAAAIELDARFLEQEHRTVRIVWNFISSLTQWKHGDPRRSACARAIVWRAFSPGTVAAAGGIATLVFLIWQTSLLKDQNQTLQEQNRIQAQTREDERDRRFQERRTQLIAYLYENEPGTTTPPEPLANARTRREAIIEFVALERSRNGHQYVNLRSAHLQKLDLSGADLHNLDLTVANLSETDLSDANLAGSILKDTDLRGAHFNRANLGGVTTDGAMNKLLEDIDYQGVNLFGADIGGLIENLDQRDNLWIYSWRDAMTLGCRGTEHLERRFKVHDGFFRRLPTTKELQGMTNILRLKFNLSDMDDDGLKYLARFQRLEDLNLADCKVTSAGLKHLRPLKSLRKLGLYGIDLSSANISDIAGLTNLSELSLENTHLRNDGLAPIKSLVNLEILSLAFTDIDAGGIRHLGALPKLRVLDLATSKEMTGEGLQELVKIKSLEELKLSRLMSGLGESNITDAFKNRPGLKIHLGP